MTKNGRNAVLADILERLADRLDSIESRLPDPETIVRLEAATVELSREVAGLRQDLREEEAARRAVGVTVMEHDQRLSAMPGRKAGNGA